VEISSNFVVSRTQKKSCEFLKLNRFIRHGTVHLTNFATKSSEIITSSRRAGITLQNRSLLYKMQKKLKANPKKQNIFFCFFDFVYDVEFCYTGFIGYTNNN
jgi:hypothetical protein